MSTRLTLLSVAGALALGASGAPSPVTLAAPAKVIAGIPLTVTVRVAPPPRGAVSVSATADAQRVLVRARGTRGVYRATLMLAAPGVWTLAASVAGQAPAVRTIRAVSPPIVRPFAVTVASGAVFVADGANGRILRISSRGRSCTRRGC